MNAAMNYLLGLSAIICIACPYVLMYCGALVNNLGAAVFACVCLFYGLGCALALIARN